MPVPTGVASLQMDNYRVGYHSGNGVPWVAGKTMVNISALMSDQDTADTTKSGTLYLLASFDEGATYIYQTQGGFQGGSTLPPPGGVPLMPGLGRSYAGSGKFPDFIRADVSLANSLSVGTVVSFS